MKIGDRELFQIEGSRFQVTSFEYQAFNLQPETFNPKQFPVAGFLSV